MEKIYENILLRSTVMYIDANIVGNRGCTNMNWQFTKELILEKNHSNAINAINDFQRLLPFEHTTERIVERNRINAMFVIKSSGNKRTLPGISEFILVKNHSNAIFARKDFPRVQS